MERTNLVIFANANRLSVEVETGQGTRQTTAPTLAAVLNQMHPDDRQALRQFATDVIAATISPSMQTALRAAYVEVRRAQ